MAWPPGAKIRPRNSAGCQSALKFDPRSASKIDPLCVYGLVRAFRTAGARNVLVTLWPLNDGEARDFMVAFYRTWLKQAGRSDPAKALRETRITYLNNPDPKLRDPRVWAPYVLVE